MMVDVNVNAWIIFQQSGQNVIRKAPYKGGEDQQGFYFVFPFTSISPK